MIHRPIRAFKLTNGIVTVQSHDQNIAEFSRRGQVTNVADVQDIEAAIGRRDALAFRAQPF